MNRYIFMVLSIVTAPAAIVASYPSGSNDLQQPYTSDPYSQEKPTQSYYSNSEIGDRSWETTTDRMNRQAASTANTRSNENRDQQTQEGSWETTSSRMNRQAASDANTPFNSSRRRNEQNRNDSDAATSRNTQR